MSQTVVGVDPGGRQTGVVTRRGERLFYGATVTREVPMPAYVAEVVDTIRRACGMAPGGDLLVVAVEGVNAPSPHLGLTNVAGLLDTAMVLGAVLHAYPEAVVVPPGGHGSAPLATYPSALVGKGEVVGTGKRRHMRSAWDAAGAARVPGVGP